MPANTRDIKRRLRSIENTKQITKAMELVSAAKMRRAVQAVLASRRYAMVAWDTVLNLAEKTDRSHHRLLQRPTNIQREAVVIISTNRGLCGGFNQQLLRQCSEYIERAQTKGRTVDVIVLGKKGREAVLRSGWKMVAEFPKADVITQVHEVSPLARLVIDDFQSGAYDRIMVAYTDFVSSLRQVPKLRQLLPLERISGLGETAKSVVQSADDAHDFSEYLFEPTPDVVLELMLQSLVEVQVYQAMLESNASEHSARMLSMRNASDNADEYLDELTLSYNQARQGNITRDLAEISASRAALET